MLEQSPVGVRQGFGKEEAVACEGSTQRPVQNIILRGHVEKASESLGKQSDAHNQEKLVPDTG